MTGRSRLFSRLEHDDSGATIVEFAFVIGPMLLLILGGFELAYESYLRAAVQGALADATRRASVEDPVFSNTGTTLEEKVEQAVVAVAQNIAPSAQVNVTQQSYFDFSSVGNSEKLITDNDHDGRYDPGDHDCFEDANRNNRFDLDAAVSGRGNSDDVVFYRATITASRLLPVEEFTPFSNEFTITLEAAVRNQPYGTQPIAPVVCGVNG